MASFEIKENKIYIGDKAFEIPYRVIEVYDDDTGIYFQIKRLEDLVYLTEVLKDSELVELLREVNKELSNNAMKRIVKYIRENIQTLTKDRNSLKNLKNMIKKSLKVSTGMKEKFEKLLGKDAKKLFDIVVEKREFLEYLNREYLEGVYIRIINTLNGRPIVIIIKREGDNISYIAVIDTNFNVYKKYIVSLPHTLAILNLLKKNKISELLKYVDKHFRKHEFEYDGKDVISNILEELKEFSKGLNNEKLEKFMVLLKAYLI